MSQTFPDFTSETVSASKGMVSSVDHLASSVGVSVLRAGGNAVDAAIATNAVLTVTTQHQCGLGGDLFALVHDGNGQPAVLNSSGRSGSGADVERLRDAGFAEMPALGDIAAVPVPGCVDGWLALHERFGTLPIADLLRPAANYAEHGFPASAALAEASVHVAHLAHHQLVGLRPGDRVQRPGVARALTAIGSDGRDGFYGGEFGEALLATGAGEFIESDLAQSNADWVDPVVGDAWGHKIWTTPPNSQGYLGVAGSKIAAQLDLPDDPSDPLWAHLMIEAARAAAWDRLEVLHEHADGNDLVSDQRLDERRQRIDPNRAVAWGDQWKSGGTIYMCVVDGNGMGVSLIQSNAQGFGSHILAGETGIFLQNRGIGFSLEAGHPAEYGPRRRPPHTLSPALVTRSDGSLRAVVGTMGGDSQPHVVQQIIARLLNHGETAGEAISAGRFLLVSHDPAGGFAAWKDRGEVKIVLDPRVESNWRSGLEQRGHTVGLSYSPSGFGQAHCIEMRQDGTLFGRSDPRAPAGAAQGF